MRIVDLRSDTVTTPTLKMRQAMKDAEVGDDGFGDDPTTNRLEKIASDRAGKEDAIFVPSGIMGNLISIMVLTKPGDGVICDRLAHINTMVAGSTAALTGTTICPLDVNESGHFNLNLRTVQTNIICYKFELPELNCKDFVDSVAGKGVRAVHLYGNCGRMVTHKDLNESDIAYVLEVFKDTVSEY
ncbi:threonine aldolase [Candidatus Scalindua japonica]|uniref:Threonine aldolase n=2 Tax=Candidatus Scalindua japonica TaxID=1284222 RepID=A0A286TU23_9BACT|nr:threonine aldolase [Candidatus Scalindua japonica]